MTKVFGGLRERMYVVGVDGDSLRSSQIQVSVLVPSAGVNERDTHRFYFRGSKVACSTLDCKV